MVYCNWRRLWVLDLINFTDNGSGDIKKKRADGILGLPMTKKVPGKRLNSQNIDLKPYRIMNVKG